MYIRICVSVRTHACMHLCTSKLIHKYEYSISQMTMRHERISSLSTPITNDDHISSGDFSRQILLL